MSDMIKLTTIEKTNLIPKTKLAEYSAKSKWFKYRTKSIEKTVTTGENNQVTILGQILIVLVKIYWELKKPNGRV